MPDNASTLEAVANSRDDNSSMTSTSTAPGGGSIWDQVCERLPQQQWPCPALYVVATPIGNLADLTPRAWYALASADVIAAEDTRASRVLLDAWQIQAELISVHRHNEKSREHDILERLSSGQKVALVSDAGAPGVSDPGGFLIQAVRKAGFPVIAIPGPSAVITALMAFGTTTDDRPGFVFLGFLPHKSGQRQRLLQQWASHDGTLVCFEAPHRLAACLRDMATVFGDDRQVCLARELTKRFEQTDSLTVREALERLDSDRHRHQGEYVLLVPAAVAQEPQGSVDDDGSVFDPAAARWADALLETVSTRDAARIMAKATGKPRDACYAWLLTRSTQRNAGHDPD